MPDPIAQQLQADGRVAPIEPLRIAAHIVRPIDPDVSQNALTAPPEATAPDRRVRETVLIDSDLSPSRISSPPTSPRRARAERRRSPLRLSVRQFSERPGQQPPTGVEEGFLRFRHVEPHGINEGDDGFGAYDQRQGVGDAVEVLVAKLAA